MGPAGVFQTIKSSESHAHVGETSIATHESAEVVFEESLAVENRRRRRSNVVQACSVSPRDPRPFFRARVVDVVAATGGATRKTRATTDFK